jgi:hypothetical protein
VLEAVVFPREEAGEGLEHRRELICGTWLASIGA